MSPRTIFGSGSLASIGAEAGRFGVRRVAVFTTKGVFNSVSATAITSSLEKEGVSSSFFTDIEPEPSVSTAEKALAFIKESGAEGVIGVGGGSVMDVAKAAAAAATNNGLAACAGINSAKSPALPMILVPTTAGTGSEATTVSVLIDAQGKKFVIYSRHLLPSTALIDPLLTHTMPKDVTVHSGMDALCHAVESYLSVNSSKTSEAMALSAISLIAEALPAAAKDPSNASARHDMSLAAHLAGVAMTNSGAEVDGCPIAGAGITHAVGLAIGARYSLPHGLSVGMVLPHAMNALKESSRSRLESVGNAIAGRPDADAAIDKINKIMLESGMKRSIRECGKGGSADIEGIVNDSLSAKRLLVNCSREISKDDMQQIVGMIM